MESPDKELENKISEANARGLLKDGERVDSLQRNGLCILQHPEKFCFGMDAVLLSHFVGNTAADNLLDLCTGTGIIPILLSAKTKVSSFEAIEIQEESADMARRSVSLNNLEDRINIVTGDLKEAGSFYKAASFDAITCNPPYMIGEHGITNPDSPKAVARHEIMCTLDDVVRVSASLLKVGGHFYMVHRPFRLPEIMVTMSKYKLEPKRMRLVYPYADKEPNMVLIEGVRGGNPRMTVEKPLIIYDVNGNRNPEISDIYEK